jgi:hypothetical protein
MFPVLSLSVWALAALQLPGPASPKDDPSRPKLIAKGKGYFLHALPPAEPLWPARIDRIGPLPLSKIQTIRGVLLLHTSTATGEMKILAAGGTTLSYVVERNSGRPDCYRARIAGVAADKERIYVLRWQSLPDKDPSMHLVVFRPDTGEQVHSLQLKGDGVPKEEPKETTGKGPLQLHPDGVTCFSTRFEFKGTRLIKQSKAEKP